MGTRPIASGSLYTVRVRQTPQHYDSSAKTAPAHAGAVFIFADGAVCVSPHVGILLTDDTEYKVLLASSGQVPTDNPS